MKTHPGDGRRFLGTARIAVVLAAVVLAGCSINRTIEYEQVDLVRASDEVPETARLDVGIIVFDDGIEETTDVDERKLIFPEVRKAEARYFPYHLKSTLESTGHWGSVWVVPERSDAVDLTVWGRIDRSDGLNVAVRIGAWDATGREWLNRKYTTVVPEKSYSRYREAGADPYQSLYNDIANDLLELRGELSARELGEVRQVAELRYGAQLLPAAFGDYLARDGDGEQFRLRRLPAADDPTVARMLAVREREYALVDTLNEYYANLYYGVATPYEDWRRMSREEMVRYQDLRRSAYIRGAAGVLSLLAAVLYESKGGDSGVVTMAGIYGGFEGIRSALEKRSEANVSRDALAEMGSSFNAEAEPLVVEVEGQTRRLTGTAEERYREWRRLLHEIYSAETGGAAQPLPVPE